jgi:hypothetical protein
VHVPCSNIFDALSEDSGDGDKFSSPARTMKAPSSPPPLYRKKAPALDLIEFASVKPLHFDLDDCPANVTIRTKPKAKKPVCWADMSDDEDDDIPGPWSKLDSW